MRKASDHREPTAHPGGYKMVTTNISMTLFNKIAAAAKKQGCTPGGFMKLAIADRLDLSKVEVSDQDIGAVSPPRKSSP